MKRLLIFICIGLIAITACKKDSDNSPMKITGTWMGDKVQLQLYEENGDIKMDTTVSLQPPNFAQTILNSDSTFSITVKIEGLENNQEVTKKGTYSINGNKIILKTDVDETIEGIFMLKGNVLLITLGTPGVSELKYTFKRD